VAQGVNTSCAGVVPWCDLFMERNKIMDSLWVRLQGDRLEFGEDRVGAPAPMARSTTDTERLGER